MHYGRYPYARTCTTFHHAGRAVRHPDAPFAGVAAVIGKVHTVHHVIFMPVDILIAKATDIVHLRDSGTAVIVLTAVPGILVHDTVDKRVRNVGIDTVCLFVTDGIGHAARSGAAGDAVVRMLATTTLFLAVTTAILRIKQVGDTRVHQRVNLLHPALDRVIMEVGPAHARGSAAAGDTGAQLAADDAAADNRTKMLVVGNPVGFHVLDPVGVGKDYLVELRGVQYGEMQRSGTGRNVGDQVHARLELVGEGRNYNGTDNGTGIVSEYAAHKVSTGNARETHALVTADVYLADGIRGVGAVAVRKRVLAAHDLTAVQVAARPFDVIQREDIGIRDGGHVILAFAAVAGVMLAVQVIVDALAPEKRLEHHPVTLAAVKFGRAAVGVIVGVAVVQRVIGHLTVRVVHRRIDIRDGHVAGRGLPRHFRKYTVTLF